jgi:hypothetical protein
MYDNDHHVIPLPAHIGALFIELGKGSTVAESHDNLMNGIEDLRKDLFNRLSKRLKGVARVGRPEIEPRSTPIQYAFLNYTLIDGFDCLRITSGYYEWLLRVDPALSLLSYVPFYDWDDVEFKGFSAHFYFRPAFYLWAGQRHAFPADLAIPRINLITEARTVGMSLTPEGLQPDFIDSVTTTIELLPFGTAVPLDNLYTDDDTIEQIAYNAEAFIESGAAQQVSR